MNVFVNSQAVIHPQFINSIHNKRKKYRTRRDKYKLDEYIQGMEKL